LGSGRFAARGEELARSGAVCAFPFQEKIPSCAVLRKYPLEPIGMARGEEEKRTWALAAAQHAGRFAARGEEKIR